VHGTNKWDMLPEKACFQVRGNICIKIPPSHSLGSSARILTRLSKQFSTFKVTHRIETHRIFYQSKVLVHVQSNIIQCCIRLGTLLAAVQGFSQG